jgi:hypothetical protein
MDTVFEPLARWFHLCVRNFHDKWRTTSNLLFEKFGHCSVHRRASFPARHEWLSRLHILCKNMGSPASFLAFAAQFGLAAQNSSIMSSLF